MQLSGPRWGLVLDSDIARDDEVWVLFGYRMPVVFRPKAAGYLFISPVYTHGWTKGEAVTRLADVNADRHTAGSNAHHISSIRLI